MPRQLLYLVKLHGVVVVVVTGLDRDDTRLWDVIDLASIIKLGVQLYLHVLYSTMGFTAIA